MKSEFWVDKLERQNGSVFTMHGFLGLKLDNLESWNGEYFILQGFLWNYLIRSRACAKYKSKAQDENGWMERNEQRDPLFVDFIYHSTQVRKFFEKGLQNGEFTKGTLFITKKS